MQLQSDVDTFDDILQRMHSQRKVQNTLAPEIEGKVWLRRKLPFKSATSDDILDFPEMTDRDLKILFTGTYQLAQAVSYLAEMVDTDGKLRIEYVKDKSTVLKLRVPSRHISRTAYRCFLRCKPNTHYTCECANGQRTVGCCSHIAAVVFYLSFARYLSKILKPAEVLSDVLKKSNYIPVIESDSDND